jgi:hypothetical protein
LAKSLAIDTAIRSIVDVVQHQKAFACEPDPGLWSFYRRITFLVVFQ